MAISTTEQREAALNGEVLAATAASLVDGEGTTQYILAMMINIDSSGPTFIIDSRIVVAACGPVATSLATQAMDAGPSRWTLIPSSSMR
eukprot:scaffold114385_cov44-Prasinocladus_malaysianus.AAC.1